MVVLLALVVAISLSVVILFFGCAWCGYDEMIMERIQSWSLDESISKSKLAVLYILDDVFVC